MCNCFKDISEKLKTINKYKKPIVSIHAPSGFSMDGQFYVLPFTVSLEGQKKDEIANVVMIYCPICGQKFNENTFSV